MNSVFVVSIKNGLLVSKKFLRYWTNEVKKKKKKIVITEFSKIARKEEKERSRSEVEFTANSNPFSQNPLIALRWKWYFESNLSGCAVVVDNSLRRILVRLTSVWTVYVSKRKRETRSVIYGIEKIERFSILFRIAQLHSWNVVY